MKMMSERSSGTQGFDAQKPQSFSITEEQRKFLTSQRIGVCENEAIRNHIFVGRSSIPEKSSLDGRSSMTLYLNQNSQ